MAARFVIRFQRAGRPIPITQFRTSPQQAFEQGIVLDGETSAFPRKLSLSLSPIDAGTKVLFKQVQQRHGWVNRFDLEAGKVRSGIRFEGVDGASLPEGRYDLKLAVGELPFAKRQQVVKVSKSSTATVVFDAKPAKKTISLSPFADFDQNSLDILNHEASMLDGFSAVDWLTNREHQDRRKACLLNILAKLAAVPTDRRRLNRVVRNIFHCEMDRIYCAVEPAFHRIVKGTFNKDATIHSTHKRLLARIPHARAKHFKLISYREDVASSMQAVVAVPPEDVADRTHYVDLDIDKNNPSFDAARFLLHIGDLFNPNKTNHFKIRKTLMGQDTEKFVYYKVV